MEIKEIDKQGRVVIPKEWRRGKLRSKKVLMKLKDDRSIEIIPYNSLDLTKYFDKVEVDLKSSLGDWHAIRKELRKPETRSTKRKMEEKGRRR